MRVVPHIQAAISSNLSWALLVVNVLSFYSDDPNLNPAKVHSSILKNGWPKCVLVCGRRPKTLGITDWNRYYTLILAKRPKSVSCCCSYLIFRLILWSGLTTTTNNNVVRTLPNKPSLQYLFCSHKSQSCNN